MEMNQLLITHNVICNRTYPNQSMIIPNKVEAMERGKYRNRDMIRVKGKLIHFLLGSEEN